MLWARAEFVRPTVASVLFCVLPPSILCSWNRLRPYRPHEVPLPLTLRSTKKSQHVTTSVTFWDVNMCWCCLSVHAHIYIFFFLDRNQKKIVSFFWTLSVSQIVRIKRDCHSSSAHVRVCVYVKRILYALVQVCVFRKTYVRVHTLLMKFSHVGRWRQLKWITVLGILRPH